MPDYRIARPATLDEALALLAQHGEAATVVAGGTWVTLAVRHGLLSPSLLLSLQRLPELTRLETVPDGSLLIGAATTHRAVERAPLVRHGWPVLTETLVEVANVRVREQATLGGNLCEADPASDPPTVLTALGATVELLSTRGRRVLSVADFVLGTYQTARQPDELLTAIRVPPLTPGTGVVYLKFRTRSHEDRPAAGVAALVSCDATGRVRRMEVVVGAAGDRPQRFPAFTAPAFGQVLDEELVATIAAHYADAVEVVSDLRASAWYRRELVRVLVARALRAAAERAGWPLNDRKGRNGR